MEADVLHVEGNYPVNQNYELSGVLQSAIDGFEGAAFKFSLDGISDAAERQKYRSNIQRVSRVMLDEVHNGRASVTEAVETMHRMRNQIMLETRAVTSVQGLAVAEWKKPAGYTLESLRDRYSVHTFKKPYTGLSDIERQKINYTIIESAGRDNARFTIGSKVMQIVSKVALLATAAWATYSVMTADNKFKELLSQGAILGGSAGGGMLGGLGASAVCGPGMPVCAIAFVLIGSVTGAVLAEKAVDSLDEELEEFTRWGMN